MRKIIQDKLYFVFCDSDGIIGFTIKAYEGEPVNPRFLFDDDFHVFLLRRPGQVILLDSVAEELVSLLLTARKVRFLETPEDSSKIVRQYDVTVTKVQNISLSSTQIVPSEEPFFTELLYSA